MRPDDLPRIRARRRPAAGPTPTEAVILSSILGLLCGLALGVILADEILPMPACVEVANGR